MSEQDNKNRSTLESTNTSTRSSIIPTARSPSITTAFSNTEPNKIPTALSTSANTAIGATDSEIHGRPGMTDTSAGSFNANSKSETTTAIGAKSQEILLNNLRRGTLFGTSRGAAQQATDITAPRETTQKENKSIRSVTNVTFSNNTSSESGSQVSSIEKTEDTSKARLSITKRSRKTSMSNVEKNSKNQVLSEIIKQKKAEIEKKKAKEAEERIKQNAERNKQIVEDNLSSMNDSAVSGKSKKMLKSKGKKINAQDTVSKKTASTARSKFSTDLSGISGASQSTKKTRKNLKKDAKKPGKVAKNANIKASENSATSSVEESQKTAKEKKPAEAIPKEVSQTLLAAQKIAAEKSFKSSKHITKPSKAMGNQSTYMFPGAGRTTMAQVDTKAAPVNEAPNKLYDISELAPAQRGFAPAPQTKKKSLFGKAAPPTSRATMNDSSSAISSNNISTSPTATGNKVVLYGTTPDGKNQVEFTVFMRIVAGEAMANHDRPIDLVPKKVIVGGKEIPVDTSVKK